MATAFSRRGMLLQLAVEGLAPTLTGAAAALTGGAAGGRAIDVFGRPIVEGWSAWLRQRPPAARLEALSELADLSSEEARRNALAALQALAPAAGPADHAAAADYLAALPGAVRRSLVTDAAGHRSLTLPGAADTLSLLPLLPADLPPYPTPAPLPGTEYRLEELIATGGFGAVYRASAPALQYLPLAIKFCLDRALLPALRQERSNLERLMQAGAAGWSPRVIRLYGYNLDHATPHLVYEFAAGGDLARSLALQRAREGHGPTPAEALALVVQVAEGLAFAHAQGLVHRDLKPANVLLAEDGCKLADFGIGGLAARQAQSSRIGTVAAGHLSLSEQASLYRGAGTPLYMSPEQRQGAGPDPRHDLYSLGVLWYQLLVGDVARELHPGWARELEVKHAVPREHIDLIGRCVGWIEDRPRDAGELLQALRPAPQAVPVAPLPPSPPAPTTPPAATPAAEGDLYRRIRLSTRVKAVQDGHQTVAQMRRRSLPLVQGIFLGLLAGYLGGMALGTLLTPTAEQQRLAEISRNDLARDRARTLAPILGVVFGLLLCLLVVWLRLRFRRKAQARAEADLNAALDGLVAEFPAECQVWGGRPALAEPEVVHEVLRELETARR
jgi:serine/threonine protein kinase